MNEKTLMHRIALALTEAGARVFRNQVGKYRVLDDDGDTRWITTGLGKGSSDLVGWHTVTVTPGMVGARLAVFVAVEVKRGIEQATDDQKNFINQVIAAGGIGVVARDVNVALRALDQARGDLT